MALMVAPRSPRRPRSDHTASLLLHKGVRPPLVLLLLDAVLLLLLLRYNRAAASTVVRRRGGCVEGEVSRGCRGEPPAMLPSPGTAHRSS